MRRDEEEGSWMRRDEEEGRYAYCMKLYFLIRVYESCLLASLFTMASELNCAFINCVKNVHI